MDSIPQGYRLFLSCIVKETKTWLRIPLVEVDRAGRDDRNDSNTFRFFVGQNLFVALV